MRRRKTDRLGRSAPERGRKNRARGSLSSVLSNRCPLKPPPGKIRQSSERETS
ncbi:MAG: hypothetical protein LBD06_02155 [Candidatus Accumulibacter sp.]|nr:hypothetical protein [Accumulibacter sp.]